jgi:hypothetical protein
MSHNKGSRQMKRVSITVGVVALVAAFAPGYPATGAPPKNDDVTIAASPNPVTFGQSTTISGKVKGAKLGDIVQLQADEGPLDGSFKTVAQGSTQNNGDYTFAGVRPAKLTAYRVVAPQNTPPATSASVNVGVRISVRLHLSDSTPKAGRRVTFSGTVKPPFDGRRARIQRQVAGGGFKTIAKTTLLDAGSTKSKYSKAVRILKSGLYRVLVPGDSNYLEGSAQRTITVH